MAGLLISTDLLFANSLCQRAGMMGKELVMRSFTAACDDSAVTDVRMVLIDLPTIATEVSSAISILRSKFPSAKLVAFGPHVHEALLQSAVDAGCDEVITRGQMHQFSQRYLNQL